jgi:hypothetical protein
LCRPVAFLLTGGRVADWTAGAILIERMSATPIVHADKGYNSNAIPTGGRRQGHTAQGEPEMEELLRALSLQGSE